MISFDRKSHIEIIEKILMDKYEYNLIASAVHVGLQNDGHYVAFVKRRNKWYFVMKWSERRNYPTKPDSILWSTI